VLRGQCRADARVSEDFLVKGFEIRIVRRLDLAAQLRNQVAAPLGQIASPRCKALRMQGDPEHVPRRRQQFGRDTPGDVGDASVRGDDVPMAIDDERRVGVVRGQEPLECLADRRHLARLERALAEDGREAGREEEAVSFAGGHAIVLGASDRRLKAVVAQVPTIDGYQAGLRRVAPGAVAELEAAFAADERAQLRGEPPATQAIVSEEGITTAACKSADEVSFYLRPVPDGVWENTVTLRSTRWARMYTPGEFVERVSPTPLLMVVADHDHTAATDLALNAHQRALAVHQHSWVESPLLDDRAPPD
jgi:hypothetical protein